MERSDTLGKLATALSAFSAELTTIEENATNPFHKAKYADLKAILEAARPVMAKHGLSVAQFPISGNGDAGIETVLMHVSGEFMAQVFTMPMQEQKGQTIQQAGSYFTYLRRYGLAAVLGLATGDVDPDAVAPPIATKMPAKKSVAKKATPAKFDAEAAKAYIRGLNTEKKMLSVGQRGVMVGVLDTTFGGSDGRHKFLLWLTGKTSIKDITPEGQYAIWLWLGVDDSGLPTAKALETAGNIMKEMG